MALYTVRRSGMILYYQGSPNCVAVVLTTFPPIYTEIYHEKPGVVGLQYISLGLGMHLGRIVI